MHSRRHVVHDLYAVGMGRRIRKDRRMRKVLTVILSVIVTLAIVAGVWWYVKTTPVRRYEAQTRALKRIVDRQELELKAYKYGQAINKIKASAKQPKMPPVPMPRPAEPDDANN